MRSMRTRTSAADGCSTFGSTSLKGSLGPDCSFGVMDRKEKNNVNAERGKKRGLKTEIKRHSENGKTRGVTKDYFLL